MGRSLLTRRGAVQAGLALPLSVHATQPTHSAAEPATRNWAQGRCFGFTTANVPDLDRTTLQALRATGARLARVGLVMQPSRDRGHPAPSAADLASLQGLLDDAVRMGVGVVVLASFEHGVERPRMWHDPVTQDGVVAAWAWLAHRIGSHPAVVGLDLLNEPNPPTDGDRIERPQRAWRELAQRVVTAIRATGCRATVIFEPVLGANARGLVGLQPLDDPAVVYSIHFYTPHDITHQGVSPRWTRRIPYPADLRWQLGAWDSSLGVGTIDGTRLARELRFAREFQLRHAVPIYVGEFGCVRWAPDGTALRWVGDCLDLFRRYGWSWTFHSFRTWPGWDPEMASEDPADHRRRTDAPMMRLLREAMLQRPVT